VNLDAGQGDSSVTNLAHRARSAARMLAETHRDHKDRGLHALADAVAAAEPQILAANDTDVAAAEQNGTPSPLIDRLRLTSGRIAGMADGLRALSGLTDPVGEVVRGWSTPAGVQIRQIRVPLGVVGIIYEARPNVTTDAAGICVKSGNAAMLRGSASAAESNAAIVAALRGGLDTVGLPRDSVQLVTGPRQMTDQLMAARGLIDVLIPRGGAGLIQHVVADSAVPVIETGAGNCHLYVDADADTDMALSILLNAKTQRPSVCNAIETMLVHREISEDFLPEALKYLADAGVSVYADDQVAGYGPATRTVTTQDFATEYNAAELAVAEVDSLEAAIEHIRDYGSGHSETIVTDSGPAAQRFVTAIDAAAVLVNASSRFVDGGAFGFGAEIGISTQKLHARGPMGLPEMTSTKYVAYGAGHVRG
jgi:glutamate-5-semialdehyde dehydrogenase